MSPSYKYHISPFFAIVNYWFKHILKVQLNNTAWMLLLRFIKKVTIKLQIYCYFLMSRSSLCDHLCSFTANYINLRLFVRQTRVTILLYLFFWRWALLAHTLICRLLDEVCWIQCGKKVLCSTQLQAWISGGKIVNCNETW